MSLEDSPAPGVGLDLEDDFEASSLDSKIDATDSAEG
jgi:hypothetical protein